MQELMDTRKENCAVKSSNSQLKEEVKKYKSVVQSLETQGFALQSHCTVADETKLVTSKVRLFIMSSATSMCPGISVLMIPPGLAYAWT